MDFTKGSLITDIYLQKLSVPTRYVLFIFLGSLLLTISAKINIPFYPVPMTLQTLVVLFIGITYGKALAPLTILFYLIQGMIGLPVFASGGGLAYLMGPTGGYLVGFLLSAIFLSYFSVRASNKNYFQILLRLLGATLIIFFCGIVQLTAVLNISLNQGFSIGLFPFILGEICKVSILTLLIPRVFKNHI